MQVKIPAHKALEWHEQFTAEGMSWICPWPVKEAAKQLKSYIQISFLSDTDTILGSDQNSDHIDI